MIAKGLAPAFDAPVHLSLGAWIDKFDDFGEPQVYSAYSNSGFFATVDFYNQYYLVFVSNGDSSN